MDARKHVSLRVKTPTVADLDRLARQRGISRNELAERYLEEGLRLDEHPLIAFRDGAAGRRAALAGTRLDVWQVIESLRASDNDPAEAAAYFGLAEAQIRAAARYYAANRDEVDAFAEQSRAAAEREEELWRGEQALLA